MTKVLRVKGAHPKKVAIELLPVEQRESGIQSTEVDQEKIYKKQNQGIVKFIGKDCGDWLTEGDIVSFYRSASTEVKSGESELMFVHIDHILAILYYED